MDLNDPRRRLVVAQQANPSLRVAVAPPPTSQPKVVVGPAPNVQKTLQVTSGPAYQAPVHRNLIEQTGDFAAAVNKATYGTVQDWIGDAIKKANDTADLINAAGQTGRGNIQSQLAKSNLDAATQAHDAGQIDDATYQRQVAKAGTIANAASKNIAAPAFLHQSAAKTASDAAETFLNVATVPGLDQLAAKGAKVMSGNVAKTGAADAVANYFKSTTPDAMFGAAYGVNQTAGTDNAAPTDYLKSAAAGGILGHVASAIPNAISGLKNIFGKSSTGDIATDIARSTSSKDIQKSLNSLVGDTLDAGTTKSLSDYLVTVDDPNAVREIVQSLNVDPRLSLSDSVKKQYQDNGITDVQMGDTPYGAEYDGNGVIKFKDQSFATDGNAYHELGHHLYSNKLTPEEQALFADYHGGASKQAEGRPGYTPSDLASEDFSDMLRKALTGHINDVPEQFRPVIEKYAGVAAEVAPNSVMPAGKAVAAAARPKSFAPLDTQTTDKIGELIKRSDSTPVPEGHTRLYQTNDSTAQQSDQFFKDRDILGNYINGRADNAKLDFKDVPNEHVQPVPGKPDVFKVDESAQKAEATPAEQAIAATPETHPLVGKDTSQEEVQAALDSQATNPQVSEAVNTNADEAVKAAKEPTPYLVGGKAGEHLSPDTKSFLEDHLTSGLNRAESNAAATVKGYTAQKAERAAAGLKKAEGLTGDARVNALKSALSGEYDKVRYRGLAPKLDEKARQDMYEKVLNEVQMSPKYKNSSYDTINFQTAWQKAMHPEVYGNPTKSDIKALRDALGDGVANKVDTDVEASRTGWDKTLSVLSDLSGTPKGLMASLDFSFGLRQGAKLGALYPKEWAKAQGYAARFVVNPDYMKTTINGIKDMTDSTGENVYKTLRAMKIKLTALDDMSEETMAGVQHLRNSVLDKVGIKGDKLDKIEKYDPLAASDRAYSGAATMQRALTAQKIINSFGGAKAMTEKLGDKGVRDLGKVINSATGAADLGAFEKFAPFLGKTLFSPRLWKSNLDVINPVYYAGLSPAARKLAVKTNSAFLGVAGTVLAAAATVGADVNTDPTSADFLKIKIGNTRYDIFGGLQQNAVLFAREALNKKTNSETGDVTTLSGPDHGFGQADRLSVILDFFQNKSNPLLSTAAQLLKGEDRGGNPINPATTIGSLAVPLNIQSIKSTTDDTGSLAKGIGMNVPGFFGVGVQTYGKTKTVDKGVDGTYAGPIKDNMVLNGDKPILDKKGNPITVKFPDGATDLEKRAMLADKRKSAMTDQYTRTLSAEDQSLLKLDDKKLKQYVKDGAITQDRYDSLQETRQNIKNLDGVEVDDNIKSDAARGFYEKYNSLSPKKQKEFMDGEPDDTAKSIAKDVNTARADGLSEFKPSNKLAKLYADYEKDVNSHADYTDIDKRNKAKAFQLDARKLNESNQVNDIFSEGGSKDLKTLISNGKISKDDLAAAIKMDNELFDSGITDSLKFSKKFRKDYGLGLDAKTIAEGGGSGSGSGGSRKTSAHLTDYLVNSIVGTSPVPRFSAKTRTRNSFSSPGSNPGAGDHTVAIAPFRTTRISKLRKSI